MIITTIMQLSLSFTGLQGPQPVSVGWTGEVFSHSALQTESINIKVATTLCKKHLFFRLWDISQLNLTTYGPAADKCNLYFWLKDILSSTLSECCNYPAYICMADLRCVVGDEQSFASIFLYIYTEKVHILKNCVYKTWSNLSWSKNGFVDVI